MKKTVDCKELALKKVKISGDIIGKFGEFEIEQTFVNNTKHVIEAGYTFPIAESATVVGFEIVIGDKILKGKVKEKSKAKKEYQKNIVKGNSAFLLDEESENIFALTIGKLDKNEEATVKIKFIDKFSIVDNQIKMLVISILFSIFKNSNCHYRNENYYFLKKMRKNACRSGKYAYFCKIVMDITVMEITILS